MSTISLKQKVGFTMINIFCSLNSYLISKVCANFVPNLSFGFSFNNVLEKGKEVLSCVNSFYT